MLIWKQIVLEAFVHTTMIFLAHGLPLNTKIIEPAMAKGKAWAYVAGFLYYAAALTLAVYIIHRITLHQLDKHGGQ